MTQTETLRLALEALEMFCEHGSILRPIKTRDAIKAALEAKGEIDWKDMYEKQKRHTEMWVAKYEKDIGPLEKAVPQQEAKDEPVAWCVTYNGELTGNIFENRRIADLCKRNLEAKYGSEESREVVPIYTTPPQRTWIGLSDKLKVVLVKNAPNWTAIQLIEETELLLKEKNT